SLAALEVFFLESLSAFEVTHRGFRDANQRLQRLIQTLEERNTDLNRSNSKLAREVEERERTEQALRRSETHFRELFRQAQLMQENLRELSHRILHVQEEERKRLSRELHDEVGQAMTAIHVNLIVLAKRGDARDRWTRDRIRDTQHLLEQ